ncbi:VENN motif pre-toxin domain-containing protein [Proteus faecis]|uniref:VENN motif pre-toxin domain-containing protein n=1 Tax=Proteus faecis TaxID=2050967 RepID=UPI0021BAAFE6|nr:VENN motif pre-toxin domain-containing protein [Proteus faecis]MCT8250313.1 VENN motif pre-toxin domain-containing protein [Proteus faecis]
MGGADLIAQKDLTLTGDSVQIDPVIVRNDDKQKQDVNKLNRDTEYANDGSINPIFDKEKEQNRLKQSQLIGEIGNQTMDIIRAEGEIAGYKAQKDPDALVAAKEQLEEKAKENNLSEEPTEAQIQQRAYDNAMAQYGTGSDVQKAAQAVTGLLQGLAGDNLAGALANASSPYLATKIKELTTDLATGEVNKASNAMAHAVLGAVVAELNNQSVVAGGLGAGGGELSAQFILNTLFEGKKVSDLSEKKKQQVSALSQLAAGLAGGLTTGDMAGAVTAAQAGKNAVENNSLTGDKTRESLKQSNEWWKQQVRETLGENLASQVTNGILNAIAETGDVALFAGDSAFDATAAVVTCGLGDSYCQQAISDLNKKDQAVSNAVNALTSGESWEAVKDTVNKTAEGDQKALENLAGMLTTILTPAKALTTVEQVVFWLRKVQLLPVVSLNGCRIFRRVINLMLSSLKTIRIMNCM